MRYNERSGTTPFGVLIEGPLITPLSARSFVLELVNWFTLYCLQSHRHRHHLICVRYGRRRSRAHFYWNVNSNLAAQSFFLVSSRCEFVCQDKAAAGRARPLCLQSEYWGAVTSTPRVPHNAPSRLVHAAPIKDLIAIWRVEILICLRLTVRINWASTRAFVCSSLWA